MRIIYQSGVIGLSVHCCLNKLALSKWRYVCLSSLTSFHKKYLAPAMMYLITCSNQFKFLWCFIYLGQIGLKCSLHIMNWLCRHCYCQDACYWMRYISGLSTFSTFYPTCWSLFELLPSLGIHWLGCLSSVFSHLSLTFNIFIFSYETILLNVTNVSRSYVWKVLYINT